AAPNDNTADTTVDVKATPAATPALATTVTGAGRVGEPVSAHAALSAGASPTGTITFKVYGDAACATPLATSTANVAGNGDSGAAPFTPAQPGTYRWTASYGGDGDNDTAEAPCGAPIAVKAVPALTLDGGPSGATATLTGGSALTGALTFSVYADA